MRRAHSGRPRGRSRSSAGLTAGPWAQMAYRAASLHPVAVGNVVNRDKRERRLPRHRKDRTSGILRERVIKQRLEVRGHCRRVELLRLIEAQLYARGHQAVVENRRVVIVVALRFRLSVSGERPPFAYVI